MPRTHWIASLIGLSLAIALSPAAAQSIETSACTPEALKRPLANTLFERREYLKAVELLQQVVDRQNACDSLTNGEGRSHDWYWLRSDLALAYLRAGQEAKCRDLLRPLVGDPRHPDYLPLYQDSSRQLERALETNLRLCNEAHERRLADYQTESCPWPIHDALGATRAGPDRCLALTPRQERGGCPTLVEIRVDTKQRIRLLDEGTSPLADPSRCCNIQKISINKQDADYRIRLIGEGRDCFGGSAYDLIDSLYLWRENQLRPLADHSRTM